MHGAIKLAALGAALILAGCNVDPPPQKTSQTDIIPRQNFDAVHLSDLRAQSCSDTTPYTPAQSLSIASNPLDVDSLEGATLNGLTFVGAWHLTSDEPNFGGLSGLVPYAEDSLLAVSDNGAFVWISLEDGQPSGLGAISYMRGSDGDLLDGKNAADAEGLEFIDGLALVSFERDHRVMAFDLANCGASANGTLIARIPETPEGTDQKLSDNGGPEALAFYPRGQLVAGIETPDGDQAIIGRIVQGGAVFSDRLPRPPDGNLTGLDGRGSVLFALFRNYNPLFGNTLHIHAHGLDTPEPQKLATLKRPFPVDNFEGLTTLKRADGTLSLYIISDDNFSDRQRTLLMAFDLSPDLVAN